MMNSDAGIPQNATHVESAEAELIHLGYHFDLRIANLQAILATNPDLEAPGAIDAASEAEFMVEPTADRIAKLRASDIPGLAVKARALSWALGGPEIIPPGTVEAAIFNGLVADLLRVGDHDAELLRLGRQLADLQADFYQRTSDAADRPDKARFKALVDTGYVLKRTLAGIASLPASSPAAMAVKAQAFVVAAGRAEALLGSDTAAQLANGLLADLRALSENPINP